MVADMVGGIGEAEKVVETSRPDRVALLSIVIGDSTVVGYGSRGTQVYRWPDGAPETLERASVWDKWTQSSGANRDTDADSGDGFEPITRAMGFAATDVGLEYSLAYGIQQRYKLDDMPPNKRPQVAIVKYGVVDSSASLLQAAASSWSPLLGSGLWKRFRDYYLDPAIANLDADESVQSIQLDGIYLSLGMAEASLTDGSSESMMSNIAALVDRIHAHLGVSGESGLRTGLIVPPLCVRGSNPEIDLVRGRIASLVTRSNVSAVDADGAERGGLGNGATPLLSELSGQGIVDIGSSLADSIEVSGHQLYEVTP